MITDFYLSIPEFDNYGISPAGAVINFKSKRILKHYLSGGENGATYPAVDLYKRGKKYKRFIHRLIVIVFHKKSLTKKEEVDHLDKNVFNFSPDNFQVVSRAENMRRKNYGRVELLPELN